MVERLQKILSQAGVASRRASEQLMREGRVMVNGVTVTELGTKADAEADDIRVDGRRIRVAATRRYILLNKPRGYVTTRSDPERRPTVLDLLAGVREYVYPVGRLDFDSEGLLLLTNDGDLAARLTHPRHGVPRVYEATVLGVPDAHDLERLRRGIVLDDRRTQPARVMLKPRARRRAGPGHATLVITLTEGRQRQVRRMCEAIGHPVDVLRRVAIGPLRDERLEPGRWRDLSMDEIRVLRASVAQSTASKAPTVRRRQAERRPRSVH
jgi:pseudouridine synthase